MQTPDSQESKTSYQYLEDELQLPLQSADASTDGGNLADTEQKVIVQRCSVIVSSSPEFPSSQDNTWNDSLNLPINSLENLEETLDIQGYENVGREEEHGIGLEDNSPVFINDKNAIVLDENRVEQDRTAENYNLTQEQDCVLQENPIDRAPYDECLQWPIIQQETASFNELSDVLMDSYRLNRETSFLLEMIDDGNIPQNVIVSPGSDNENINRNTEIHTEVTNAALTNCSDDIESKMASSYPFVPSIAARTQAMFGYSVDQEIARNIEIQENLHYLARMDAVNYPEEDIASEYQSLIYEAREVKQTKRKEKNRECSRMFRYKQRMKEDTLKKGKLEKQVFLRSLFHEQERLRSALFELARHCGSCDVAMEFLSEFANASGKENTSYYIPHRQKATNGDTVPFSVIN